MCHFCSEPGLFQHLQFYLEAYVFEGNSTAVVISRGLQLTAGQTGRMNACVNTRGIGLGAVFVHTLAVTDVEHNGLVMLCLSS